MINPCWILCSPRCGSTYLCDLLNNTNLFKPPFSEYFNLLETPEFNPFCKVQPSQWVENKLSVQKIKNFFPNIKFVQIKRKNFVDRAVSYYLADTSAIWSIGENKNAIGLDKFKKPKYEYLKTPIEINEEKLNRLINKLLIDIKIEYQITQEIGSILQINYEQISEPETLHKILQYVGHNEKVEFQSSMEQMPERPEKEQVKKLIHKYFVKLV